MLRLWPEIKLLKTCLHLPQVIAFFLCVVGGENVHAVTSESNKMLWWFSPLVEGKTISTLARKLRFIKLNEKNQKLTPENKTII